jgi:hypothetical protein
MYMSHRHDIIRERFAQAERDAGREREREEAAEQRLEAERIEKLNRRGFAGYSPPQKRCAVYLLY